MLNHFRYIKGAVDRIRTRIRTSYIYIYFGRQISAIVFSIGADFDKFYVLSKSV